MVMLQPMRILCARLLYSKLTTGILRFVVSDHCDLIPHMRKRDR